MLKTLAGVGVATLALAAPAFAQQPNIVIEFTALEDTMTVSTVIPGNTISTTELPQHPLAKLILTHDALSKHTVQASDMTNPITDDERLVSFIIDPQGCCNSPAVKGFPAYTIDIPSFFEPIRFLLDQRLPDTTATNRLGGCHQRWAGAGADAVDEHAPARFHPEQIENTRRGNAAPLPGADRGPRTRRPGEGQLHRLRPMLRC